MRRFFCLVLLISLIQPVLGQKTKVNQLLYGVAYYGEYMPYNMDIPNKNFRFHAERIIRKIMEHVKDHPAIIGYQVDNEYKRPGQFVTQNFDFEWRGFSYGIQSDVDHFAAAQGFPQWVLYPGQLRLQAFSHLASDANMVEYWHWHSIHNSTETYWKGVLSHDFEPNPAYKNAKTIGHDFKRLSSDLINPKKVNKVAILFSNKALTAFNCFKFGLGSRENYNDKILILQNGRSDPKTATPYSIQGDTPQIV